MPLIKPKIVNVSTNTIHCELVNFNITKPSTVFTITAPFEIKQFIMVRADYYNSGYISKVKWTQSGGWEANAYEGAALNNFVVTRNTSGLTIKYTGTSNINLKGNYYIMSFAEEQSF